ncbi:MAG: ACT domain-containing protein, partial [Sulfuricellaceae bacterium]|nr:ACT domain-containing protein [Sulfuricellaceae bacterium]
VPQVSIHPDEKNEYFVLSLAAGDRPGLLSDVANVLVNHHIDVHTAKIATLGERAEDTFLIAGDSLYDDKAVSQLENDLLRKLQASS